MTLTTRTLKRNTVWLAIASMVAQGLFPLTALGQQSAAMAASDNRSSGNKDLGGGMGEHLRANPAMVKSTHQRKPDTEPAEIEMFAGESRVFPAPGVARIAVGNGQILTAAALDGKEVILFANEVGVSSLFIWHDNGQYQRLKINIVRGDTSRVAREIATFIKTIPGARSSIVGDKVIVEGDNIAERDQSKLKMLSERYPQIMNFTSISNVEDMVMMDVKVVEFPVNRLREVGLKWQAAGGAAVAGVWSPGGRGAHQGNYQINMPAGNGEPPVSANPALGDNQGLPLYRSLQVLSGVNMGIQGQLTLLEQSGEVVVLSEPQLAARSGSTASFIAGGEFPYSVASDDGVTVVFKPYGVRLEITPRVDRQGIIRAQIKSEVSSIDSSITTASGPALLTRQTNTEFNVASGQSIVLSGLIQREKSESVDQVPGLGALPIIGRLFKSKRFQNKETELVVFVTPTLVRPESPGVVDRIAKVDQRLTEQLGDAPHLSQPLQPGTPPARLDLPPAPPPPKPVPLAPMPSTDESDGMPAHVTGGVHVPAVPVAHAGPAVAVATTPAVPEPPTTTAHPRQPTAVVSPEPSAAIASAPLVSVASSPAPSDPSAPAVTTTLPKARVRALQLILRDKPSIMSDRVGGAQLGDVLTMVGVEPPSVSQGYWCSVQLEQRIAWAACQYLEVQRASN